MLTRRLQVLVDDECFEKLSREAKRRRMSIGALVREAIDRVVPNDAERRRAAVEMILAAEPMPVPADPADLKAEIRAGQTRGL